MSNVSNMSLDDAVHGQAPVNHSQNTHTHLSITAKILTHTCQSQPKYSHTCQSQLKYSRTHLPITA